MSATDIKTRHDTAIQWLTAQGQTVRQIFTDLGVSGDFVRQRLKVLGLREQSAANGYAFQRNARLSRVPTSRRFRRATSACGRAIAFPGRADMKASMLLARVLSTPRDPSLLTDNAIACLHEVGLTLADLECAYGLPQPVAVAAIRRAHGAHP
jgi:hypothetical protein